MHNIFIMVAEALNQVVKVMVRWVELQGRFLPCGNFSHIICEHVDDTLFMVCVEERYVDNLVDIFIYI